MYLCNFLFPDIARNFCNVCIQYDAHMSVVSQTTAVVNPEIIITTPATTKHFLGTKFKVLGTKFEIFWYETYGFWYEFLCFQNQNVRNSNFVLTSKIQNFALTAKTQNFVTNTKF